jgi:hypothetical protein
MTAVLESGLCIGDLISLKAVKFDAFLGAEGILLSDLITTDSSADFDDCVFAVHLQRQYSAAKELETFMESRPEDEPMDDGAKQYLNALSKGRSNEIKLNDNYMEAEVGKAVNFGDIVQLYHIKSRKYLIVNPKELATVERENSRVHLDANGNVHSWIQFMPRFKIDKEGDRILGMSEVYIGLAERPSEFIHCAEKHPKKAEFREVNCSLEKTSWRCEIFQETSVDGVDQSVLLPGQLVYIHDAENRANLTIASTQPESLDEEKPSQVQELPDKDGVSEHKDTEEGVEEYQHEHGDLVLQPMKDLVDMRSVWTVEGKDQVRGNPIVWKSDHVRFKNLATGMYVFCSTLLPCHLFVSLDLLLSACII